MMESPQKKAMNCSVKTAAIQIRFHHENRLDQAKELIFHGLRRDQFRDSDMINHKIYITGWWHTYPSEKGRSSWSWDDEIPNCFWKVIQNSMVPVTTKQINNDK